MLKMVQNNRSNLDFIGTKAVTESFFIKRCSEVYFFSKKFDGLKDSRPTAET